MDRGHGRREPKSGRQVRLAAGEGRRDPGREQGREEGVAGARRVDVAAAGQRREAAHPGRPRADGEGDPAARSARQRAERPGPQEPEEAPQVGGRVEVLGADGDEIRPPEQRPRSRRARRGPARRARGRGGAPASPGRRRPRAGSRPSRRAARRRRARGTRRAPRARPAAARRPAGGRRDPRSGRSCRRSCRRAGRSGPVGRRTRWSSAPASRSRSSSCAPAAGASTPRTTPTRSPRRARTSAPYVAPAAEAPAARVGRGRRRGTPTPTTTTVGAGPSAGGPQRLGRPRLGDRGGAAAPAPSPARGPVRRPGRVAGRSVYWPGRLRRRGDHVYFYELHEGDDDLYSDVLLARDEEIAPEDFFDLVQAIRRRVAAGFEEDTLIEAIAVELERSHGFVYVSDERLTAAVNVSTGRGRELPDRHERGRARGAGRRSRLPGRLRGVRGRRRRPQRLTPAARPRRPLLREEDLQDVPVADAVGLPLRAQLAVLARLGRGAERERGPRRAPSRPG